MTTNCCPLVLFFFSVTMCLTQPLCHHWWEFRENARAKSQVRAGTQTSVCHRLVRIQRIRNVKVSSSCRQLAVSCAVAELMMAWYSPKVQLTEDRVGTSRNSSHLQYYQLTVMLLLCPWFSAGGGRGGRFLKKCKLTWNHAAQDSPSSYGSDKMSLM